jgi:NTP pyrophosphatase (non-canonical NTP hydrolase)
MEFNNFQQLMREIYFHRDSQRGAEKVFMWIIEEMGELGRAIRTEDEPGMKEEIADVVAWVCSLGNVLGVDVEEAVTAKYSTVCPRCQKVPCECPFH